jgi:hypothetical protein
MNCVLVLMVSTNLSVLNPGDVNSRFVSFYRGLSARNGLVYTGIAYRHIFVPKFHTATYQYMGSWVAQSV